MQSDDRRQYQRLKLTKPILARVRGANALVLDIGFGGALVEHNGLAAPGEQLRFVFKWQGEDVAFNCEVARSSIVASGREGAPDVSHTGLRFVESIGDARARLQELIASFVGHVLAAQKANATGTGGVSAGETILARLGEAHRTRARGFITYRLVDGTWSRSNTSSPRQPADGFTVGAHEDGSEVDTLCRTYEGADEAGRRLIRMVAELSVTSGD